MERTRFLNVAGYDLPMKRKASNSSFRSDSAAEDYNEYLDASRDESIFMAAETSSNCTGHEKEFLDDEGSDTVQNYGDGKVTEESPLLASYEKGKYAATVEQKVTHDYESSVPTMIYASPVRPYLPSPSSSSSRVACKYSSFEGDS